MPRLHTKTPPVVAENVGEVMDEFIGVELGLSRERIRQLKNEALSMVSGSMKFDYVREAVA